MKEKFFETINIQDSDYPKDFIPSGAKIIIGCDYAKDGDCTVKGFYDPETGEYHIQEIIYSEDRL